MFFVCFQDGHYYLRVVQSEEDGLLDSCHRLEKYLDDGGINEEGKKSLDALCPKTVCNIDDTSFARQISEKYLKEKCASEMYKQLFFKYFSNLCIT